MVRTRAAAPHKQAAIEAHENRGMKLMNAATHDAMATLGERSAVKQMITQRGPGFEALRAEMAQDRAILIELRDTLPILIAGIVQVTKRLDTHDEIMRLCIEEASD